MSQQTHPPLLAAVLLSRCPNCGRGRLFSGFLTPAPRCEACGLDYDFIDSGDGPAVFIVLIVGFLTVMGALVTEIAFRPPYWLHALIWAPVAIGLSLVLLRPAKALLIALQYRHKAEEARFDG